MGFSKSDGLQKYIKQQSKKGKKLFGGIVVNTNQRNYSGKWIYFNKNLKNLKDNNFSNWENLEL